jgi:polyphosphate kinase 2 (PPK2 family)
MARALKVEENVRTRPLRLRDLDMDLRLSRKEYEAQRRRLQLDLVQMQRKVGDNGMQVLIVFEGMDGAGKGGAIQRLTQHLDPRGLRVHSVGPATEYDAGQHFLRRYWMRLPKRGRITIFDDYSWYSRILQEPIEGYCSPAQYRRAPEQIRVFEKLLAEEGYCLIKFWIQVDRDEQHKRFERRLQNPYKSWKLTPEDWRNRELYDKYMEYADKMFTETDASHAPWFLIPGNCKYHARVEVLKTAVDRLRHWPVEPVDKHKRVPRVMHPWTGPDEVAEIHDE